MNELVTLIEGTPLVVTVQADYMPFQYELNDLDVFDSLTNKQWFCSQGTLLTLVDLHPEIDDVRDDDFVERTAQELGYDEATIARIMDTIRVVYEDRKVRRRLMARYGVPKDVDLATVHISDFWL